MIKSKSAQQTHVHYISVEAQPKICVYDNEYICTIAYVFSNEKNTKKEKKKEETEGAKKIKMIFIEDNARSSSSNNNNNKLEEEEWFIWMKQAWRRICVYSHLYTYTFCSLIFDKACILYYVYIYIIYCSCVFMPPISLNLVRFPSANQYSDERLLNTNSTRQKNIKIIQIKHCVYAYASLQSFKCFSIVVVCYFRQFLLILCVYVDLEGSI